MNNLKQLRKNEHLTQQKMADLCGITLRSYQNYENGLREMSYSSLIKLADFFGCSVDYLIGHQTNDLVYLSGLSDMQKEMIEEVKQMSDDDLYILKGVLLRLKQEKENPWLKRN